MTVAVLTGGGSGIGRAVAMKLASQGVAVALCDLDGDAAGRTAADIAAAGGTAIAVTADVTNEDEIAAFVERAENDLGRPTMAVACAGIATTGLIPDTASETFRKVVDVNLTGVFLLAKHTIPRLRRGGGTFTAIASDAGLNGFQGFGAYCASKHAVVGLVKSLALDHGPEGVRSNAICPGYVDTPMLDRLLVELGGTREEADAAVPLGRLASVDDVAELVSFVTSDAASYINGAMLSLDGGGVAGPYAPA